MSRRLEIHPGAAGIPGTRLVVHAGDDDRELASAVVDRDRKGWWIDHRVDAGAPLEGVVTELLTTALDAVRADGGGPVRTTVVAPDGGDDARMAAMGLHPQRDLYQMRVRLPLAGVRAPRPGAPAGANGGAGTIRGFRPGDDDAWLVVNNAAFATHPEQGDWTRADLRRRMDEPWFDADGLLVHEAGDGRIDGFCWTKVHADEDPPLGEIFVIAVHPDAAGQGLGRALARAGLAHLHDDRGMRWGMLYVDADNAAAVALYEALGFEVHHVERVYTGTVS